MRINLTTPMSDDKERQRQNAAMLDAIERYTEERMNDDKALVQRLRRTYRKEYAATGSMFGDNSNKPFPFPILATEVLFNPDGLAAANRIEQLEREKAVVSDLWEQQKEIALDYLTDCNKAAERIEAQAAEIEWLRDLLNHVANEADHDCETMWITDIIHAALKARGFEIREKNDE